MRVSLVVALLLAGCGREAARPVATPTTSFAPTPTPCPMATSVSSVRVRLESFRFVPSCFSMRTSQALSLRNAANVTHNLTIPGTMVDLDTLPAQETNTETLGGVVRPGVYAFYCKYHRARGMTGTIYVLP